jgi:hypothetical protein
MDELHKAINHHVRMIDRFTGFLPNWTLKEKIIKYMSKC